MTSVLIYTTMCSESWARFVPLLRRKGRDGWTGLSLSTPLRNGSDRSEFRCQRRCFRGFGGLKRVKQENWEWLRRLNAASRKRRMAIVLLARLTPLIPSGVVTFAAAVSRMRFFDFIAVSVVGKAPSVAMETMVGHDLIRLNEGYPRLLVSLLFFVLLYILFRKRRNESGDRRT